MAAKQTLRNHQAPVSMIEDGEEGHCWGARRVKKRLLTANFCAVTRVLQVAATGSLLLSRCRSTIHSSGLFFGLVTGLSVCQLTLPRRKRERATPMSND